MKPRRFLPLITSSQSSHPSHEIDASRRAMVGMLAASGLLVACSGGTSDGSAPVVSGGDAGGDDKNQPEGSTDPADTAVATDVAPDGSAESSSGDAIGLKDTASEAADCSVVPGTDRGALADFPNGKWVLLTGKTIGENVIIGHDGGGLFAYTAICTHKGCRVQPPDPTGGTRCLCHGARYDKNGAVTQGPATKPLQHYALSICSGRVFVDPKSPVDATIRVPT
ncbi:MAG: hypothetical protein NVSMB1_03720 [Polyangiales bacterium]